MTVLDLCAGGLVLSLALACQSTASTASGENRTRAAGVETTTRQDGEARVERVQPVDDVQLVDRVHEIADNWEQSASAETLQKSLFVSLTADGSGFKGTSTHWPVVVTFYPKAADSGALLHLAFTEITGVSLAEIERRFGPPAQKIEAKESLAAFESQSGARLVITLLGGIKPSSSVSAIKLEGVGPKRPLPKDLF